MSKRKEFNKKVFAVKLVLILILGLILGISCFFSSTLENLLGIGDKEGRFVDSELIKDSKLSLHYINVDQGDSTLIILPDDKVMLIDAAEPKAGDKVVNYLKEFNISTIDYFVLTHSDDDHSGGAEKVFNNFEVKNVYRPFQISVRNGSVSQYEPLGYYLNDGVVNANEATEVAYEKFLKSAYSETYVENGVTKEATVWCSYDGLVINSTSMEDGEGFSVEFFAPLKVSNTLFDSSTNTIGYPVKSYSEHSDNNASPVMLLEYNESSFVFTGDAAFKVEEDFLASLDNEEKERFSNVDVFQAGHHGSNTSNSEDLLELLKPTYVVASCLNSKYGHPGDAFVNRLETSYTHTVSDYLLRTDLLGNIVFGFTSDGSLAYTALKAGIGESTTIYWWYIAVGAFIAISFIIITVKITPNKTASTKRVISKSQKVIKKIKK